MFKKNTKRILVLIVAVLFLILGVAGLVLPFLQGILFLAIGFVLLSMLSPTVQEKIERQTRKYPKVHAIVLKVEKIIRSIWKIVINSSF
jgi:uncharacterized membrane protein YbaN (DUF454 family)